MKEVLSPLQRPLRKHKHIISFGYRRTKKTSIEDISPEDGAEKSFVDYGGDKNARSYGYSTTRKRLYHYRVNDENSAPTQQNDDTTIDTKRIKAFNKIYSGSTVWINPPLNVERKDPQRKTSSQNKESHSLASTQGNATLTEGWEDIYDTLANVTIPPSDVSLPLQNVAVKGKRRGRKRCRIFVRKSSSTDTQVSTLSSSTESTRTGCSVITEPSSSQTPKKSSSRRKSSSKPNKEMDKASFNRCLQLLRKWYRKLPLINAHKTRETAETEGEQGLNSVIFTNGNHLDIRFTLGKISSLLTCPLCKGLFFNAHTIRECMHTFCKSCFVMYTVEYGLSCPICHRALPPDGMEGVCYDNNMQSLVDKLFPSFEEREVQIRNKIKTLQGITIDSDKPFETQGNTEDQRLTRLVQLAYYDSVENLMGFSYIYGGMYYEYISHYKKLEENIYPDRITLVALLTADDCKDMNTTTFNVGKYLKSLKDGLNGAKRRGKTGIRDVITEQGLYIAVPRYILVSDLSSLVIARNDLKKSEKLEFSIGDTIVHHNHTVYFVCRMIRADLHKCVLIRYRILEPGTEKVL